MAGVATMPSAISTASQPTLRGLSRVHRYRPCVSAVEQDDGTCSSVPGLSNRLF